MDLEVKALRLVQLCMVQCALVLCVTEHLRRGAARSSAELTALHVQCVLHPDPDARRAVAAVDPLSVGALHQAAL